MSSGQAFPGASLPYEFHVSREARDRCRFDESLFSSSGRAVLAHPAAAHRFAAAFDAARPGAPRSSAADVFALGLLDEAAHVVLHRWRESQDPSALREILGALRQERGAVAVERLLLAFVERFPPLEVYRAERAALAWLAGSSEGR